jgi:hypothetical protein
MEQKEVESARATGNFDIVRRGVVFSTTDEMVNIISMFGGSVSILEKKAEAISHAGEPTKEINLIDQNSNAESLAREMKSNISGGAGETSRLAFGEDQSLTILTESQALEIMPAIPLYFPFSYSLVKPYVKGFDSNVLDAVSLRAVSIDREWKSGAGNRNANSAN